jgi:maltooligosyltrehalose synthase
VASRFPARGAAPDAALTPPGPVEAWRDLLTGRRALGRGGVLELPALLADLPVAVLVPDDAGG